ncbi:MAG: SDR family NAD(P)-dependent oxidoreductase, partial [Planctomycetota bacterium]
GGGAADLYRNAPGALALNGLVADAVDAILARLPAGRGLRVLEIGAGTGATTERVLQRAGVERVRYVFTDVAPGFLAAAQRRLPSHANLSFRTLDIEQDPTGQGFSPHAFDVVIAANVLHATADIAAAVQHTRKLLAPGGQLVLVEGVRPTRWLDLTFGLTDGWWRFADAALRPDHPLLSVSAWRGALAGAGFTSFCSVAPGEEGNDADGTPTPENSVMVATAGGACDQAPPQKRLAVVAWDQDDAASLAEALAAHTQRVTPVTLDRGAKPHAIRAKLANVAADELIVVAPLTDRGSAADAAAEAERGVADLLAVFQAVAAASGDAGLSSPSVNTITLVTRGAQSALGEADGDPRALVDPTQAALWGFVRAAAREAPEATLRCIDVPAEAEGFVAAADEVLSGEPAEAEVVLRAGGRWVARLRDASPAHQPAKARKLTIANRGTIDGTRLDTTQRQAPGAGEVQVRVAAAGLNFRDVLNVLGRYPGAPPLGAELSGVVAAVGEGVQDPPVAARVVAASPGGFADYVNVPAAAVLTLPEEIGLREAATLPVAYATAAAALEEVAGIGAGTRVLIHTATGGVGMAALQLAASRGATVFATASPGKQPWLRGQGVRHVYTSRTARFADGVLADSGGAGVDVVLNTLGEDLLEASLRALAQGGRLIDLTKPAGDTAARVRRLRPDVAYTLIDLADEWSRRPQRIGELLRPVLARVAGGELTPLPAEAFPLDRATEALRLMQRGGHLGKLLITPTDAAAEDPQPVDPAAGAWLVTGGFGDLGLMTGRWLAERGARVVGLLGRRPPSDAAEQTIKQIKASGAAVLRLQADVADASQLTAALAELRAAGEPLVGVVHSAGTLADGLIAQQDAAAIARVFAAKAHGLWNLHRLTADDPLQAFVAYSSIAAVLGSPGQTNHAAANAFMDALVANRNAQGRCGLTINWGPWGQIGEAARRGVAERSDLGGVQLLSTEEGRQAMDALLGGARGQCVVAPWDLSQTPAGLRDAPLLEELTPAARGPSRDGGSPFLARFTAAPAFRRRELVVAHVRATLAAVLGIRDASAVQPTAAMFDLGLDSLTTIELKNTLHNDLQIELPPNVMFDFPTVERLAGELHRRLAQHTPAPSDDQPPTNPNHDPLADIQPSARAERLTAQNDERPTAESNERPAGANDNQPAAADTGEQTAAAATTAKLEGESGVWDDLTALQAELESWEGAP